MDRASPKPPFVMEIGSSAIEQCVNLLLFLAWFICRGDYLENFQPGSRHHNTCIPSNWAGSVVM